jgi:hypothetical protein
MDLSTKAWLEDGALSEVAKIFGGTRCSMARIWREEKETMLAADRTVKQLLRSTSRKRMIGSIQNFIRGT